MALSDVMLNKYASKYAGKNTVRLHTNKKLYLIDLNGAIIGVEPTTFALRKRADSKMSIRMSMLKIIFLIKYKYQKDKIKVMVQRLICFE
ncbi:hypothetical protein ACM6T0_002016 [Enterobacter kobei]